MSHAPKPNDTVNMMPEVKSMREHYNAEYFRQRGYEFPVRYPPASIIAEVATSRFNPKKVLDIGCAKGYLVYAFRELAVESYGVDISEYALSQSPREVKEYVFNVDVDLEDLPFESQSFGLVTATECIEHLQNPMHIIGEMARVLKPNGAVVVAVPKKTLLTSLGVYLLNRNPTITKLWARSQWLKMFQSCGFSYIGGLWNGVDTRRYKKTERIERRAYLPQTQIARCLMSLGKFGQWLRVELSFAFMGSELLVFRLDRGNTRRETDRGII